VGMLRAGRCFVVRGCVQHPCRDAQPLSARSVRERVCGCWRARVCVWADGYSALSVRTLRDVVVVLALHMLHDAVKDPTEKRVRSGDQSNLAGLHAKASEVIAAIAKRLEWGQYLHLLRTTLIEVRDPSCSCACVRVLLYHCVRALLV
jgi:hypothetical protein